MSPDLINGLFEASGAVFLWCDVARLRRDKCVRGVYWPARAVYAAWGVWNMFYYPALGQSLSFYAGFGVVSANLVWCALAFWYTTDPGPGIYSPDEP